MFGLGLGLKHLASINICAQIPVVNPITDMQFCAFVKQWCKVR